MGTFPSLALEKCSHRSIWMANMFLFAPNSAKFFEVLTYIFGKSLLFRIMIDILLLVHTFLSLVTVITERPQTDSSSRTAQTESQYGFVKCTYKLSCVSSFRGSLHQDGTKNPCSVFPRITHHGIENCRFFRDLSVQWQNWINEKLIFYQ